MDRKVKIKEMLAELVEMVDRGEVVGVTFIAIGSESDCRIGLCGMIDAEALSAGMDHAWELVAGVDPSNDPMQQRVLQ